MKGDKEEIDLSKTELILWDSLYSRGKFEELIERMKQTKLKHMFELDRPEREKRNQTKTTIYKDILICRLCFLCFVVSNRSNFIEFQDHCTFECHTVGLDGRQLKFLKRFIGVGFKEGYIDKFLNIEHSKKKKRVLSRVLTDNGQIFIQAKPVHVTGYLQFLLPSPEWLA